jgi:superfamily I DNA/RNA helicase/RecB family exonuclease
VAFEPDPEQTKVLQHDRGPLLVEGAAGTGKTAVLRERFARLIESGADPERVALVVRSKQARGAARAAVLERLARPLPAIQVLTVHGLAHHVMAVRHSALGYERPPEVMGALDQFAKVRELLAGEDRDDWPVFGGMLLLRGFADEVRQFLLRAQEALLSPEDVAAKANAAGLAGWGELALFYSRYLDVLAQQDLVDFAGLINQAAAAAREPRPEPPFDHLLVDDFQEATFAEEGLLVALAPQSLVVAGDVQSHVFSFRGTSDLPLRRFTDALPGAERVQMVTPHRGAGPEFRAWATPHSSEEYAAVARELRRLHVEESIPWRQLAVVVRRHGAHVGGLVRAFDDAGIPRTAPDDAVSLAEPAVLPFVLALRWLARPEERDGLIEAVLTSDLMRLSPATARGLVRAAQADGGPPAAALGRRDGLSTEEGQALGELTAVLEEAERVGRRSAADAFAMLWKRLAYSRRLVEGAERSEGGRRDLASVTAFSDAIATAGERADPSVVALLDLVEAGEEIPELAEATRRPSDEGVNVLTAHATAGLEFDTVIVVDAAEGNFPSLSRPEPMFDLRVLDGPISQSARNRLRLEDERRLFGVVVTRARRRVLFAASDPHEEAGPLTARSRFVGERGVPWLPAPSGPFPEPLSAREAAASWRRTLSDGNVRPPVRLAALSGLLALGERPSRWWFQRDWTDTGRPLHENIRVSFSRLDRLENCALQYVLSEELGLEGQAGYYAWVGHTVHGIIEECENGKIPRTLEALTAAALERWQPREFPSRAVSEAFKKAVIDRMLPNWLAEYGQTEALAGEVGFEFEFEGATVSGRIDRVGKVATGGSQITDYKTGKSRSGPVEENLQLGIYFLAVSRAEELAPFRPVKQVELAFLKEELGSRRFHVQLGMNTKTQQEFRGAMTERLTDLIHQVRDLTAAETYRPNPEAQCRYCDFKTLCPLWPEGRELFPLPAPTEASS